MKFIVWTLIASMISLASVAPRAEAMLVPTTALSSAESYTRSEDMKTVQMTLESKVLRDKLHALGLSDAEIQTRLSRLSETEVHQLASQIRAVNPAGWIAGVLIIVLLVILIIYLVKRI